MSGPSSPSDSVLQILWHENGQTWSSSAVVVADGRKLITCGHCVGPAGSTVSVQTLSGPINATVLVNRPEPNDLAVLEAPSIVGVPLAICREALEMGDAVDCIGFPLGATTAATITGRVADVKQLGALPSIQIEATIDRGMSGGGVFDEAGRFVGVLKSGEPLTAFAILGDFVAANLRDFL